MSPRAWILAVGAATLAAAAPASASVRLTHVDTSSYPTIRATVVSSAGPSAVPEVTENGAPVVGLESRNLGRAKAVVVAVDVSKSMAGKPLSDAISALHGFIDSKPRADAISIVEFGPRPVQLSGFSFEPSHKEVLSSQLSVLVEVPFLRTDN